MFETPLLETAILTFNFRGLISGLRPFLATKKQLKIIKEGFYFTLKAFFVLKVLKSFP